jgi:drug/metabolite transporter (DMT)-like permease
MVFGQFPDQWTWFGSAIIFATGIYVALREWSRKINADFFPRSKTA